MIRSAISQSAKRCTQKNIVSNNKATLSTLSFHPSSLLNNVQNDSTTIVNDTSTGTPWCVNVVSTTQLPLILNTTSSYINNIKSHFSNTMTNLSGDYTLLTMDSVVRKLEEEKDEDWEDIIITTTTPKTTPIMEEESNCLLEELSLWQISTLKRRKKMMNKHKLRKRRKKNRLKTRK